MDIFKYFYYEMRGNINNIISTIQLVVNIIMACFSGQLKLSNFHQQVAFSFAIIHVFARVFV